MSARVIESEFILGADNLENLPESELPEVAFLGRSNVGKSSLINRITSRKNLARTSSTPGRTQQFNVFNILLDASDGRRKINLVDFPGHGYAKFSKKKREKLAVNIVKFLETRESLQTVCLLNDCRRMPEDDELAIRDIAFTEGRMLIVVLTKLDKLKSSQQQKQINKIAEAYNLEPADLVLTGEKHKPHLLWDRILASLDL